MLLAFSFPKFGHPALGWIALAPLLLALTFGVPLRRAFFLGLTTGAIYFGGTLYWMAAVMSVYGSINPFVADLLNAVFVAYVALYPAIFATLMRRLLMSYGPRALLAAPLVWVTTELGRASLFT